MTLIWFFFWQDVLFSFLPLLPFLLLFSLNTYKQKNNPSKGGRPDGLENKSQT